MNDTPTPPAATAAPTGTTPAATAQTSQPTTVQPLLVKTPLGINARIIGRGQKPGEVLIERLNDGARRIYNADQLVCSGGVKAIEAELERVTATDKTL